MNRVHVKELGLNSLIVFKNVTLVVFRSFLRSFGKLKFYTRVKSKHLLLTILILSFVLILWDKLYRNQTPDEVNRLEYYRENDIAFTLTQSQLDYFARVIRLNVSVLENYVNSRDMYEQEINLTNTGDKDFPNDGWQIYFSQPNKLEPSYFPYPKGLEKIKYNVRFFFINANVYRMEPTISFPVLKPGDSHVIRTINLNTAISYQDIHPNWYFVAPRLEPRVIESTQGPPETWIAPFNNPSMWKRVPDPESDRYDLYDPWSARHRMKVSSSRDIGAAVKQVIPTPAKLLKLDLKKSVNIQSGAWVIVTAPRLVQEARYLSRSVNLPLIIGPPASYLISFVDEPVQVRVRDRDLPTDESYGLEVNTLANVITIKASQPTGAFYAVQTLLSIMNDTGEVPEYRIQDAPRFRYRGFMIDVARHFQTKEKIFRYIDAMAMYKMNKLHIHLTDDEGWRLEIPGLDELTQLGSKRCHDLSETNCLLPFLGSGPYVGPPASGFYTVSDYRDILRYAAERHIEVIPEIDMPGHSHAAIRSMEKRRLNLLTLNVSEATRFLLSDLKDTSDYRSVQLYTDNVINPCLQSTYTFISRIINSLFAMHRDVNPLKTFHYGGDEVPKGVWTESPVCERLRSSGVRTFLPEYFAKQVSNMTTLYNLDIGMWEDAANFELQNQKTKSKQVYRNNNNYVYVWNNAGGRWGHAYRFANLGFKVILTPATHLYLDAPQEPDPTEPGLHWASRITDTKTVFSFTPENIYTHNKKRVGHRQVYREDPCRGTACPPLLERDNLEGIQGTLFGETLRSQEIADYMTFPRLLAVAERAWHAADWEFDDDEERFEDLRERDWVKFANTLGYKELRRLDRLGFKYRIPPPGARVEGNILFTSVSFPGLNVEISADNGQTWRQVVSGQTQLDLDRDYLLRTKAASGDRHSRQISLFDDLAASYRSKANGFTNLFTAVVSCLFVCLFL